MHGQVDRQQTMFVALDQEQFVAADHRLRKVKVWCWQVADKGGLISTDHFTVDGTLIRSWASHKSLPPIDGRSKAARASKREEQDGDPGAGGGAGQGRDRLVNRKGQKLSNTTHRSRTDFAWM